MVHADNGKDFRSYLIQDTLDEYDIRYEFRPVKTPHYGGHIERLAGTLGKKIHALPGATFSNPKQRGEYKSEAKAQMTLRDLRPWLLNLIVGVYHNRRHDSIGCSRPTRRPCCHWNSRRWNWRGESAACAARATSITKLAMLYSAVWRGSTTTLRSRGRHAA
ncbi:MAG TPA: hypothetical protein VK196_00130 [Magnetospirillum sp.]|nr:hypothetical protein [Magnetospirillum sp.]